MKRLTEVLTAALLAVMMMTVTGCSKEDSDNNMEQKQTLTKEKIVGVWRSGDYWVSFSESGYNSAFFHLMAEIERTPIGGDGSGDHF